MYAREEGLRVWGSAWGAGFAGREEKGVCGRREGGSLRQRGGAGAGGHRADCFVDFTSLPPYVSRRDARLSVMREVSDWLSPTAEIGRKPSKESAQSHRLRRSWASASQFEGRTDGQADGRPGAGSASRKRIAVVSARMP